MTEHCPTCGRPMQMRRPTAFREKLIRLADGTRTAEEIARLTGSTRGSVHGALTSLRQQGHKVRAKVRYNGKQPKPLTREEYAQLAVLRMQGLSWKKIARLQSRGASHLSKIYGEAQQQWALGLKKKEIQPATTSVCAN